MLRVVDSGRLRASIADRSVILDQLGIDQTERSYYEGLLPRIVAALVAGRAADVETLVRHVGGRQLRIARLISVWLREGCLELGPTRDLAVPDLDAIARVVQAARALAPPPDRTLDQAPVTTDSVVRRCQAMWRSGDLDDAVVIVLGDDDFMSLGIAALSTAAEILVVDLDDRTLELIQTVAVDFGLSVAARRVDLSSPLPSDLLGRFDVVATDPSPIPGGTRTFIERADEALGVHGVVWASLQPGHGHLTLEGQNALSRGGFVITDALRGVSDYSDVLATRSADDRAMLDLLCPGMDFLFSETWFRAERSKDRSSG